MNIGEWLAEAAGFLVKNGIATARLDAELLLADALKKDRSWLHAHPEYNIPVRTLEKLDALIIRRANHEPMAYIRGKQEFYGREFIVSPDTLTPRPETETMIELLLDTVATHPHLSSSALNIVDIGTGSGCIIITAALELSQLSTIDYQLSYLGLDIFDPALKIARKNADALGASIDFKHFDLTKDTIPSFSISSSTLILANLPYVPADFHINLAATHEPDFAIFGGKDGLDYYRALFAQLDISVQFVLTESLPPQHKKLTQIAQNAGFSQQSTQDFIQVFARTM